MTVVSHFHESGSHSVGSAIAGRRPRTGHGAVVVDAATPKDADGRPVLAVVWQYLMRASTNGEKEEEEED